jgi:hypothetical protein
LEDDDGEVKPVEAAIDKDALQKFEERQAQAIMAIREKFDQEMKAMRKTLITTAVSCTHAQYISIPI